MTAPSVLILGTTSQSGTYLLRIGISSDLCLSFGHFKSGKAFALPAGDYVYIGSALGGRLASRLLRHATRTPGKPPHVVRAQLLMSLSQLGLATRIPYSKTLYWHVDYLLDIETVTLMSVIAARSEVRLEDSLAEDLLRDPATRPVEPALGSTDVRGQSHLLQVEADQTWWECLQKRILELLRASENAR